MAKSGPRKTKRYSNEFKATAVRLSDLPDVMIHDVADALDCFAEFMPFRVLAMTVFE